MLLRRIASSYSARRARVVCFPTAIFISFHIDEKEHVTIAEGPLQTLRLDQMADVYALGAVAQRGEVPLRDGMQQLSAILRKPARFGTLGTILGHTILTAGVAIVLNPAPVTMLVAACLGVIVGVMKLMMRDRPLFAVPVPVVGAILVSSMVFQGIKMGLPVDPLHVLIPPLVTFLPGAMLTFGMIELAYGDMVSGASRLITGFVQLILLVFGILAGAAIVGMRHDTMPDAVVQVVSVPWLPWIGAIIFGLGVSLHFSAPKRSLPWMLLVVLLAFSAQRLSAPVVGAQFSGFFGTLVATPLGYLIQLRSAAPPMVTFLPSFWLLVPGALGLPRVSDAQRHHRRDGRPDLRHLRLRVHRGSARCSAPRSTSGSPSAGMWQLRSDASVDARAPPPRTALNPGSSSIVAIATASAPRALRQIHVLLHRVDLVLPAPIVTVGTPCREPVRVQPAVREHAVGRHSSDFAAARATPSASPRPG